MEGLVGLIVVAAILVAGVVVIRAATGRGALGAGVGGADAGRAADRPGRSPGLRQPTIDDLRPGDAISFWDGVDTVVDGVIECAEELGGRASSWRWAILSGDRLLETAPDENVLYTTEVVYRQGTVSFDELVADPDQGGALKTFEGRVRDGTSSRNPVQIELEGQVWTLESTGTFRLVSAGPLPRREVWRDISTNPSDNVYFELSSPDGGRGLGLWTTHIALLTGRILEDTDIQSLYPGANEDKRS